MVDNSEKQPPENNEGSDDSLIDSINWYDWRIILALLVFCFPVGLYLVWTHLDWDKSTKLKWTGGYVALWIVYLIGSSIERQAIEGDIAAAHAKWDEGERAEAVETYEQLLDDSWYKLTSEKRKAFLQRTIEFHVQARNEEKAREWIDKAVKAKEVPTFDDRRTQALVAEAQTEKGDKLDALKKVVRKLDYFPDRFAGETEQRQFNSEMRELVQQFIDVPFNAVRSPDEARSIVETFESEIEGRFEGHVFNLIEEEVIGILHELRSR